MHIDGNPFKQYYSQHYDIELGKKKEVKVAEGADAAAVAEVKKKSRHALASAKRNQAGRVIDNHVAEQFKAGRILACITSRPGQSGRADGYILEGKELEFYVKKMEKRKK